MKMFNTELQALQFLALADFELLVVQRKENSP